MDWVRQDTYGAAPLPGHGHSATLLGATHKKSKLVVFGGEGEDNHMLGETHILELGTWTWRRVQANVHILYDTLREYPAPATPRTGYHRGRPRRVDQRCGGGVSGCS